jgi:threonine aldolase
MQKAQKLFEEIQQLGFLEITQPRQSNAVFVKIPQKWIKALRENYFFYVWDEETFECRLMCSWDTTDADIQGFIDCLKSVKETYEIPSR